MISPDNIRAKIVERAQKQYLRDIAQLKDLLAQFVNGVTVTDAIKLSKDAEEKELKQQKKSLFNFGKPKVIAGANDGYVYTFLLRFMAVAGVEELTHDSFVALPLSKIYFESFKTEYETYQQFLFDTKDAQFYSGSYPIIRGGMRPEANADGEVENY